MEVVVRLRREGLEGGVKEGADGEDGKEDGELVVPGLGNLSVAEQGSVSMRSERIRVAKEEVLTLLERRPESHRQRGRCGAWREI